ncbi:MAG: methionine--tRNA ligase [Clostridia bacterium]|nr:methionine--tRNA ligase [Clostridia bacterium]
MNKNILIGGAWPYANGSLHIGHIASLLPGDILARFHRLKGDSVCYVSGSDCHGTPIKLRALQENKSPREIAEHYHLEFKNVFNSLGFTYDNYGATYYQYHKEFVKSFFKNIYPGEYTYEKVTKQAFCNTCNQFLPDRFVNGICPKCKAKARGDQCDSCGTLLEPSKLINIECSTCKSIPIFKETKHIYLSLSSLEDKINTYVNITSKNWRKNASSLTNRYLNEGLIDRAITRDIDNGVQIPVNGYEDKRFYVWIEAVLGYLSGSNNWAKENDIDWNLLWSDNAIHYYVHGKDNIPFHSVILPSLLIAHSDDLHLPDKIISSEYLTLEGNKISTSNNWAIWAPYLVENYNPDSIRYFFTTNGPENRDTNFSWREFINSNNSELLGAYGNFVNRSFVFIEKFYDGKIPLSNIDTEIKNKITSLYLSTENLIVNGNFKIAIDQIFNFIRECNKYFDQEKPWITIKDDISLCNKTLYTCIEAIQNLSILLEPFLPFSSSKIQYSLSIDKHNWEYLNVKENIKIKKIDILFERIDKDIITFEENTLKK